MPKCRGLLLSLFASIALLLAGGCGGSGSQVREPHLEAISAAPDFSAPDETGRLRTLSEFRGRTVVLYFYPKDGTPGCTREACAFRDVWDRIAATGAQVLGVSVDSVESHAAFKAQHALPFPLLSDVQGTVLSAYGVPRSPQGYAARTTFIIDARGMIRRIFPEVDPGLHVEEVLPVIEALARDGLGSAATPPPAAPPPTSGATPAEAAAPRQPTSSSPMKTYIYVIEPSRPEMLQAPTPQETQLVEAHFQYLKGLTDRGVLLLAGPNLEPPHFGIIVFYAEDRAKAQTVVDADPAVGGGVFKARLSEFKVSLQGKPR